MYGVLYNNWWQGTVAWVSVLIIAGTGWYVFNVAGSVFALDTQSYDEASIASTLRCDGDQYLAVTYQHNMAIVQYAVPHAYQVVLPRKQPAPPWLVYGLKDNSTVFMRGPNFSIVKENGTTTYDHCIASQD